MTVEKPDEVIGTSSLTFTIEDPVLQDLAKSTPGVSQYKCTLTPEPKSSEMEFSDTTKGSKVSFGKIGYLLHCPKFVGSIEKHCPQSLKSQKKDKKQIL